MQFSGSVGLTSAAVSGRYADLSWLADPSVLAAAQAMIDAGNTASNRLAKETAALAQLQAAEAAAAAKAQAAAAPRPANWPRRTPPPSSCAPPRRPPWPPRKPPRPAPRPRPPPRRGASSMALDWAHGMSFRRGGGPRPHMRRGLPPLTPTAKVTAVGVAGLSAALVVSWLSPSCTRVGEDGRPGRRTGRRGGRVEQLAAQPDRRAAGRAGSAAAAGEDLLGVGHPVPAELAAGQAVRNDHGGRRVGGHRAAVPHQPHRGRAG